MSSRARSGWLALAVGAMLALAWARPVTASRDQSVGVFFDPGATARTRFVLALQSFDVFVVTFNLDLPSKDAEVARGFEVAVHLDPRLLILDRVALPYEAVEVTDRDGVGDDNWLVDASQCLSGHGTVRLLRYVTILAAPADDVVICLDAPTGGDLQPPGPAWIACDTSAHPLTYVPDLGPSLRTGCGVVNPTLLVATTPTTWSATKARFR